MKNRFVVYALVALSTFGMLFVGKYTYDYYQDNVSVMSKVATEVTEIEEMKKIIEDNEEVYVYMGRPNCGDSDRFEEYFPDIMEDYNVENLYYFNIKDIAEEYADNDQYKTMLEKEFGMKYTPTLAKYVDGKLVLISQWTPENDYSKEDAIKFIKDSGLDD